MPLLQFRSHRSIALWYALLRVTVVAAPALGAQQIPDREFRPSVARPAFGTAEGPRLCLDEAHQNFHTLAERFWAFGELARRDGYRVAPLRAAFAATSLGDCELLVISNAQWSGVEWSTYPTPTPSAFTDGEIVAVHSWVERGGQLLLIADHMPLAGSAAKLAAAFGASFTDGFAYKAAPVGSTEAAITAVRATPTLFVPTDGTLQAHAIIRGRDSTERVTQVRSFTGQAFRLAGATAAAVMVLPEDFVLLEPRIAWQFDSTTTQRQVGGWLQGATRRIGSGRVAFFGEAAMFSAQVIGGEKRPMGMNAPLAEQNAQFALNTLHWLSGLLDP